MGLNTFLVVLRRRWWIIVITIAVTISVAVLGSTMVLKPQYTATATVQLRTPRLGSLDYLGYDTLLASRIAVTYQQLLEGETYRQLLIQKLGEAPDYSVTIPPNSELLFITTHAADPNIASDAANLLATSLIEQITRQNAETAASDLNAAQAQVDEAAENLAEAQQAYNDLASDESADPAAVAEAQRSINVLERQYTNLVSQLSQMQAAASIRAVDASVVESATPASAPSSPGPVRNVVLGLFFGILGGVGLALLLEHFDSRLYSAQSIRTLVDRPVLGAVPFARRNDRRFRIPVLHASRSFADPPQAAFDWLKAALFPPGNPQRIKILAITSADEREGKTTIARGLSEALQRGGWNTAFIDGNGPRPLLHRQPDFRDAPYRDYPAHRQSRRSGRPSRFGALEIKNGGEPTAANIDASSMSSPAVELDWKTLDETLKWLKAEYDVVVVDASSLRGGAEAAEFVSRADATLLVVARGKSRAETVRLALHRLETVGSRLVGTVINYDISDDFKEPPDQATLTSTRGFESSLDTRADSIPLTGRLPHEAPVLPFTPVNESRRLMAHD